MPHSNLSLSSIPLELIFVLATFLGDSDLNSLIQTSSRFYVLNSTLNRRVPPSLNRLSTKLILKIVSYLDCLEQYKLLQVSPKLHRLLFPALYWRDVGTFMAPWTVGRAVCSLLSRCISMGFDPRATNSYGYTALHLNISQGCTTCISSLLDAGVSVNEQMSLNNTPLGYACARKNLTSMTFLLDKGADPNMVDGDGRTPLYVASERKNYNAIITLLAWGAVIDKENTHSGETPLMFTVRTGHWKMAKFLVRAGADMGRTWDKSRYRLHQRRVLGLGGKALFGMTVAEYAAARGVNLLSKRDPEIHLPRAGVWGRLRDSVRPVWRYHEEESEPECRKVGV